MSAQRKIDSFAENYTIVEKCDQWLEQFENSYRIMNRVCSSKKGNRYSLQLITKVSKDKCDDGEVYHFSLNLGRRSKDLVIEGPSISIPVEYENLASYMMAKIAKEVIDKEKDENFTNSFVDSGVAKTERHRFYDYLPAAVILDFHDIYCNNDDSKLWNITTSSVKHLNLNIKDKFIFNSLKSNALEEIFDDFVIDSSLQHSNTSYQKVLNFDACKKSKR